jgi:hypothetical protein
LTVEKQEADQLAELDELLDDNFSDSVSNSSKSDSLDDVDLSDL